MELKDRLFEKHLFFIFTDGEVVQSGDLLAEEGARGTYWKNVFVGMIDEGYLIPTADDEEVPFVIGRKQIQAY